MSLAVCAILSLLLTLALGWVWGFSQRIREQTIAETTAARQQEVSNAKAKEAEISASPAGSKKDIIERL